MNRTYNENDEEVKNIVNVIGGVRKAAATNQEVVDYYEKHCEEYDKVSENCLFK